jgi:hypothetical protein
MIEQKRLNHLTALLAIWGVLYVIPDNNAKQLLSGISALASLCIGVDWFNKVQKNGEIQSNACLAKELENFKVNIKNATDAMLFYELNRIRHIRFSIMLARNSHTQMQSSGGEEWVNFRDKRNEFEEEIVDKELARRGRIADQHITYSRGVCMDLHSWDIIARSKTDAANNNWCLKIRQEWGF